MSYILNALRKSEQERQARQPETATERILLPQRKPKRKTALWIAAILLSNLLIISGFVWLSSRKTASTPAAPKAPATARVETTARTPPQPSAAHPGKPSAPPAPAKEPASASIAEQAAVNLPPKNPLPSKAGNARKTIAARSPEAAKAGNNGFMTRPDPIKPAAKQTPPPANPGANEATAAAPAEPQRIPFLEELPYDVRQSIPKMTVNVFVYSPNVTESFVVINMEKYKTGQFTRDSVELKEIRADSLIARYHDQIFRLGRPGPQRSE